MKKKDKILIFLYILQHILLIAIETTKLLNYTGLYIKRSVYEMILKIYNISNKIKNKNLFSRNRKEIFINILLIYKYTLLKYIYKYTYLYQ